MWEETCKICTHKQFLILRPHSRSCSCKSCKDKTMYWMTPKCLSGLSLGFSCDLVHCRDKILVSASYIYIKMKIYKQSADMDLQEQQNSQWHGNYDRTQTYLHHFLCRREECLPDERHEIRQCVTAMEAWSPCHGPSAGGEAAQNRTGLPSSYFLKHSRALTGISNSVQHEVHSGFWQEGGDVDVSLCWLHVCEQHYWLWTHLSVFITTLYAHYF